MPSHSDIEQAAMPDLTTDRASSVVFYETLLSPPIPNHNATIPSGAELETPTLVNQHESRMADSSHCQNTVMPDLLDVMPVVEPVTEENVPVIREDKAHYDEHLRANRAVSRFIANWLRSLVDVQPTIIDPAVVNTCSAFHVQYNFALLWASNALDIPSGNATKDEIHRWAAYLHEHVLWDGTSSN